MNPEQIRELVFNDHRAAAEADAKRFDYRRRAAIHVREGLLEAQAGRRAVVLDGPRRTGKSIALRQVAHELRVGGMPNVYYCDFTDPRLRGVGLLALVDALVAGEPSPTSASQCLLLDEVHYTGEHWARELKFVVDNVPTRVAVADSAVALVQSNLREHLAGRYIPVRIEPLPFGEWRDLRQHTGLPIADPEDASGLARECRQYLTLGGFPAHYESPEQSRVVHEILRQQIVDKAAREDVGRLRGLRDADSLEQLLVSRIAASGSQLNNSEAAQLANVSAPTARHWMEALCDTRLLWQLRPFTRSSGKHERARPKLYAIDPGLVEACSIPVFGTPDSALLGRQVETATAQALRAYARRRGGRLSYLQRPARTRDGAEIDFILEHDGKTRAIECTVRHDDRKLHPLKRLLDETKLRPDSIAVVSLRTQSEVADIDGTPARLVPLHDLLLQLSDLSTEAWPW